MHAHFGTLRYGWTQPRILKSTFPGHLSSLVSPNQMSNPRTTILRYGFLLMNSLMQFREMMMVRGITWKHSCQRCKRSMTLCDQRWVANLRPWCELKHENQWAALRWQHGKVLSVNFMEGRSPQVKINWSWYCRENWSLPLWRFTAVCIWRIWWCFNSYKEQRLRRSCIGNRVSKRATFQSDRLHVFVLIFLMIPFQLKNQARTRMLRCGKLDGSTTSWNWTDNASHCCFFWLQGFHSGPVRRSGTSGVRACCIPF